LELAFFKFVGISCSTIVTKNKTLFLLTLKSLLLKVSPDIYFGKFISGHNLINPF